MKIGNSIFVGFHIHSINLVFPLNIFELMFRFYFNAMGSGYCETRAFFSLHFARTRLGVLWTVASLLRCCS